MGEYKEIVARADNAHHHRRLMQNVYEEVMELAIPNRTAWDTRTEGRDVQRHVYDSTLQHGIARLANALFVGMFPPHLEWHELQPGFDVPEEDRDHVLAQLQKEPARNIRQTFLGSNFYVEAHPWLENLVIGTGVMLIDECEEHDVNFTALPLEECGLEEGRFGRVEGLFRKHKITARQFMRDFPDAEIPQGVKTKWAKDPDKTMVDVDNCIYREEKGDRSWVQKVLMRETSAVVYEQRFYTQPFVAPRWSKQPGEIFGRGPACMVAADAYSLNEAARLTLIQANLGLYGMYTSEDASVNEDTLELGPGAIVQVNSNATQSPTLRALEVPGRLDMGEYAISRLESSVKMGLMRDNLAAVEDSNMTATEVIERQALVAQDMGAAFGRIMAEGVTPIITRVADILMRRGKFPQIRVDGKVIGIKYVSPLARAQELEEVTAIREVVGDATAMLQIDPAAGARINTGEALRKIAVKRGAPLEILRDDEEVQEIMNQVAQAEQAAAMPPEGQAV